ncbi:MAG TPA: hypothetical protein VNA86_08735, partial [bacterium]|nr:hypothetical protein [bacterium]
MTALCVIWIMAFLLLLGRLADLQVLRARALQLIATRQQLESLTLPAARGSITDRGGRPLAINVEVESVYAVPRAVADNAAFARAVAPALRLTPAEV